MTKEELATRLDKLETENEALELRAERLAAMLEIINLQSRYNYWLELGYHERIWKELFANKNPAVKCEIAESGVYEGIESVKRFWRALASRPRLRGQMMHIMVMNPYIMVSKDGKSAKGMWWAFGPCADYATPYPGDQRKLTAFWLCGKYDNEFIKEDGKWKILSLHTMVYFRSPYEQGWLKEPNCTVWQPLEEAPPDKGQSLIDLYHPDAMCGWRPVPYPYEPIETE